MVNQSNVLVGSAAAQSIIDSMPCEPANIVAIADILSQENPSLQSLSPFFEQDFVLSLKVISAANEMMQGRSAKAIAVRSVTHALTIIGVNGVSDIVECSVVQDAREQSALHFQVYRFTLARAQFLLHFAQIFCQYHPSLHVDDIRLYISIFMLAELELGQKKPQDSHVLFHLYQRELTEFWDAEMKILETTLVDRAIQLTQDYSLPREVQQALDTMPGLEQFYSVGVGLNLKKVQSYLRKKEKEQNIILPVILISYVLVHRIPAFWGDKQTQFLMRWLSRLLHRPLGDMWCLVQQELLRGVRTYPILHCIGRNLMAQAWPKPLTGSNLQSCIAQYSKRVGMDTPGSVVSLQEAKKLPRVEPLIQATLRDFSIERKDAVQKKAVVKLERQPGDGLHRFMLALRKNPQAYGAKLPTSSALLEALRIGLSVEFCIALFFDNVKQRFSVGSISGLTSRHPVRQWTVSKESAGLLQNFLVKPAGVWIYGEKRQLFLKALPKMIVSIIGKSEAFMSTTVNSQKQPTGVILAVAKGDEALSKECYKAFQKVVLSAPL